MSFAQAIRRRFMKPVSSLVFAGRAQSQLKPENSFAGRVRSRSCPIPTRNAVGGRIMLMAKVVRFCWCACACVWFQLHCRGALTRFQSWATLQLWVCLLGTPRTKQIAGDARFWLGCLQLLNSQKMNTTVLCCPASALRCRVTLPSG